MSNENINNSVINLLKSFDININNNNVNEYINILNDRIGSDVDMTKAMKNMVKRSLRSNSYDSERFDELYNDLKAPSHRFVQLLGEILKDKSLRSLIDEDHNMYNNNNNNSYNIDEDKNDMSHSDNSFNIEEINQLSTDYSRKQLEELSDSDTSNQNTTQLTAEAVAALSKVAPTTTQINLPMDDSKLRQERDLIDLRYGSKVVLRSPSTGLYGVLIKSDDKTKKLQQQQQQQQQSQSSQRSSRHFALTTQLNATSFVISNARQTGDRGPVRLHDTVILSTIDDGYLTASNNGNVIGKKSTQQDTLAIQWQVQFVPTEEFTNSLNQQTRRIGVVKLFDRVALKSDAHGYLNIESDGTIKCIADNITSTAVWQVSHANLPPIPQWVLSRASKLRFESKHILDRRKSVDIDIDELNQLSSDDDDDDEYDSDIGTIDTFNKLADPIMEQILIEDLLYAMIGSEGTYIHMHKKESDQLPHFTLSSKIRNQTLCYLIKRMLPLCDHYFAVDHFVDIHSRYEYGLVNHALCTGIRSLLKEYLILIAQLEHQQRLGKLSLQRMWFYVQPSLHTMERLNHLVQLAWSASGGILLNTIYNVMSKEGDPQAKSLYTFLMIRSSLPYMAMLEQWIYQGVINDPCEEFQIKLRDDLSKDMLKDDFTDNFWDERYTIREDQVPVFLSKFSDKILTTGKYLNVIRECGRTIDCPFEDHIIYSSSEKDYSDIVDEAYRFASRKLLDLLLNEYELMARLSSIKRYFLLSQGDFFIHFMDMAETELRKPLKSISVSKLESLLELTSKTSAAVNDPYNDDLSCLLSKHTLLQELDAIRSATDVSQNSSSSNKDVRANNGIEAFTLAYSVKWPLSLIISNKSLKKYQSLFRHLFYCKTIERQLCKTWRNHQSTKELNLRLAFQKSYTLRQRMLHFLQNFAYYMMVEVLEPNYHRLAGKIQSAHTVDEVLRHHDNFLDSCLRECLLTNEKLLRVFYKCLAICDIFAENIERFTKSIRWNYELRENDSGSAFKDRRRRLQLASDHVWKVATHKNYVTLVQKFEDKFDGLLLKFIEQLQKKSSVEQDQHLVNLSTRIDYNRFYLHEILKRRSYLKKSNRTPTKK